MMLEIKLRKIGNSVGVVLPKEALAHLKVGEGDMVCITEAEAGSLRVSPRAPEVARQLEAAQGIIQRYRNTLRELAR